jgi:hypothetical protein
LDGLDGFVVAKWSQLYPGVTQERDRARLRLKEWW